MIFRKSNTIIEEYVNKVAGFSLVCFFTWFSCKWKEMKMKENKVDCYKCKFYYVTWDRNFPKGCKAFQFKGRTLPSLEVKKASGQECLRYIPK